MTVCEICKEKYPELYNTCNPHDDDCHIVSVAESVLCEKEEE